MRAKAGQATAPTRCDSRHPALPGQVEHEGFYRRLAHLPRVKPNWLGSGEVSKLFPDIPARVRSEIRSFGRPCCNAFIGTITRKYQVEKEQLIDKLRMYRFYQSIDLGDGVVTPGQPLAAKQKQVLKHIESLDLVGKRVIELGCANGLLALAAERRGAEEVIAVDNLKQSIDGLNDVILPHLNSRIKAVHDNVLNITRDKWGQFDLVIFAGILYHLKYPFLALKNLRDLVRDNGIVILETGIFDDFNSRAALYTPSLKDTPFASSPSYFNEKGLLENLEYYGLRAREKTIINPPFRRLVKKIVAKLILSFYPTSNIVLLCDRDPSLADAHATVMHEAVI
jgi:2-polyprenyl-3-methyl-5-hydroxy-6-metoxy-1,4-benzoquinol methylase